MPKVLREAVILLSTEELSIALGIPFDSVTGCEWWNDEKFPGRRKGLRLTVKAEEEIAFKSLNEGGKKDA